VDHSGRWKSTRLSRTVPFEANSLAWSPDGREVAWSAGVPENADLFATDVTTGQTRQVTSLPGREASPVYSPDGRNLAFVHIQGEEFALRVIDAKASNVADPAQTRSLGKIGQFTSAPQWSPESDGLLVTGGASQNPSATFVPLAGERQPLKRSADAPTFPAMDTSDDHVCSS
jgi:Tol biopolymer transport system component